MSKTILFALTLFLLVLSFAPVFADQHGAWVTVRRYEGVTDSKAAARLVQEGFVPLIRKIPGFLSYYWVDEGNGVMVSVSIFTSKEAEEESNRIAADFVKQHIAPLLPKPPQITAGKVVATSKMK